MKKILFLITIMLTSCVNSGTPVSTNNSKADFDLTMLFTIGNDTIYRFYDAGHYRYFKTSGNEITGLIQSGKYIRPDETF